MVLRGGRLLPKAYTTIRVEQETTAVDTLHLGLWPPRPVIRPVFVSYRPPPATSILLRFPSGMFFHSFWR